MKLTPYDAQLIVEVFESEDRRAGLDDNQLLLLARLREAFPNLLVGCLDSVPEYVHSEGRTVKNRRKMSRLQALQERRYFIDHESEI